MSQGRAPFDADVVIIGAGSAGCVLASRLSEDPRLQVLLLEAGVRGSSFLTDVPGMTMLLMGNPKTDWCHRAQPDASVGGREMTWNAGKMLGGGSSINGMVYIRGLRRDYDDWVQAGCTGWGWDDVLPYFRKAEAFQDSGLPSMGRDGPLAVSRIRSLHRLTPRFIDACAQSGIGVLDDYNAGEREGAFVNLTNQRRGLRASTSNSYLRTAAGRSNLRVVRGARVDRILFDNGRADSVRFELDGVVHDAKARREVLLSAGTVQSATVLLRSGIGAAQQLQAQGIALVADAPGVGQNLQDHFGLMVSKFVNVPTYNSQVDPLNGLRHLGNYLLFRRGPLASPAVQAMAWVRSDAGLAGADIHLNWFPFGIDFGVTPPAMHKRPCVSLGACVSRPWVRGSVRLGGAAPADRPLIDYPVLSDERDVATVIRSVQLIQKLFRTPALAPFVVAPDSPSDTQTTDAAVEALARTHAGLGLHCVGTCRMGTDARSVVDTELRVRGVSGLRVIDASVMPRLVSANTNAASIMIGEKGADLVKAALRLQSTTSSTLTDGSTSALSM
jgi:choline dehydrogenase